MGRTARYTKEKQTEAVALAVVSGSARGAAREYGIPARTVQRWVREAEADPDLADVIASKRLKIAAALADAAESAMLEILATLERWRESPLEWTTLDIQSVPVTCCIMLDKLDLLLKQGDFHRYSR
ncbi:MAG: transposase [Sphingomonadaceae bacterium]